MHFFLPPISSNVLDVLVQQK